MGLIKLAMYLPATGVTREEVTYLRAIEDRIYDELTLSKHCPECGTDPDGTDDASIHALTTEGHVLICCEGYFMVDPGLLGMERDGWQSLAEQVADLDENG
jgi:hypothetical protein